MNRRDFLKVASLGLASALVAKRTYSDESRRVVLTFDDNPFEIERTARLVKILKENGFQNSQFYLTGEGIIEQPESTKYLAENNFEIGWHSMQHNVMRKNSPQELIKDIDEWKRTLDKAVPGYESRLARFPYGAGTREQINILEGEGLSIYPCAGRGVHPYNWDVDTEDWNPEGVYSVEKINQEADKFKDSPVILFHQKLAKPYQNKRKPEMPTVTKSLIVGDLDNFERYVREIKK